MDDQPRPAGSGVWVDWAWTFSNVEAQAAYEAARAGRRGGYVGWSLSPLPRLTERGLLVTLRRREGQGEVQFLVTTPWSSTRWVEEARGVSGEELAALRSLVRQYAAKAYCRESGLNTKDL